MPSGSIIDVVNWSKTEFFINGHTFLLIAEGENMREMYMF